MVMKPAAVVQLAQEVLLPGYLTERTRLDVIDGWYGWSPEKVEIPRKSDRELKALRNLSETPWLGLVVTTLAQMISMQGISCSSNRDLTAMWMPWLRNDMAVRQQAVTRATLAYGYSYTTVLPGDLGAVMRGISPRDMYAVYQDIAVDEYPMYGLRVINGNPGNRGLRVIDEEAVHLLAEDNGKLEYIEPQFHDVGVTPIIRDTNQMDLEGRSPGEVEPFIPVAKRINKTSYDRLLVQHFNSWKIRTATGLTKPEDEEEGQRLKLLLRQSDILTGEDGVEFGVLDETSMDGFIKASEADIEALAAVSQTPSHNLTGKMINLSAEALAAAQSMLALKAGERKVSLGSAAVKKLRLAAHIEGREEDAQDFTVTAQFEDLESRSMAQAADALGKTATMLGVPPEMLWDRIPGVSMDDAKKWLDYKKENPSAEEKLALALDRQAQGAV
ncbi:phage portal protein [Paenarthrobacter ilicis]|uniref:phage portal protein n=1 Tax=Paenarthrobacter ilicis TaxID=43665 RepID=UPI0028D5B97E|nr:phage portal protein [Paenarthrobacter ilicis]